MRFKIISAGWQCEPYCLSTLKSIANQSLDNWDLCIVVDPSTDGTEDVVREWASKQEGDNEIILLFPEEQQRAVRNQVEALQALAPEDDDVVIFLDLDGDRFAHRHVLRSLGGYYQDGTLVTYGNYRPIPANVNCQGPKPYPDEVVEANSYRKFTLTVYCAFNHLRTMKGIVANSIPMSQFRFCHGPDRGRWYTAGTDYAFMMSGLELAGGRYKCIEEVLCLYNSGNPHADHKEHGKESTRNHMDILRQPPLKPLEIPNA